LNVADWIHLAQDSVQRQVVLNIALDILIHKRQGTSGVAETLLASQGLSSTSKYPEVTEGHD
jgi:hypothetical protein